jgi:hypothetical protein
MMKLQEIESLPTSMVSIRACRRPQMKTQSSIRKQQALRFHDRRYLYLCSLTLTKPLIPLKLGLTLLAADFILNKP